MAQYQQQQEPSQRRNDRTDKSPQERTDRDSERQDETDRANR